MGAIREMQRYAEETEMPRVMGTRYDMSLQQFRELMREAEGDLFNALLTAFRYGQAKGYRAAQAARRADPPEQRSR